MKKKLEQTVEVQIEKLVHGGQGLGVLPDGRKVFVWNALPGERLNVQLTKTRRDYAEGIAEEVLEASAERIEPQDEAYLSTSPWQMMTVDAENKYKREILLETFAREKVDLPALELISGKDSFQYRNKMEYSFWADDDGLHLALFRRGTHGKQIVTGSSIARPEVDEAANKLCSVLNHNAIRGSQLKTVVVRTNQSGEVVLALYVKDENFPNLPALGEIAKGIVVHFSTPKSPASVITRQLYAYGDITLADQLLGTGIAYDVHSFFQVNLPVFEQALRDIKGLARDSKRIVDMYSGVGTIGIPVGAQTLVELDSNNVAMAKTNAKAKKVKVVHASTEQALEHITTESCVIVDPPRAGLHAKVVDQMLEEKPEKIIYLSCNPITQARDLSHLQSAYTITEITGYNFFPRTPHIESLACLVRK